MTEHVKIGRVGSFPPPAGSIVRTGPVNDRSGNRDSRGEIRKKGKDGNSPEQGGENKKTMVKDAPEEDSAAKEEKDDGGKGALGKKINLRV